MAPTKALVESTESGTSWKSSLVTSIFAELRCRGRVFGMPKQWLLRRPSETGYICLAIVWVFEHSLDCGTPSFTLSTVFTAHYLNHSPLNVKMSAAGVHNGIDRKDRIPSPHSDGSGSSRGNVVDHEAAGGMHHSYYHISIESKREYDQSNRRYTYSQEIQRSRQAAHDCCSTFEEERDAGTLPLSTPILLSIPNHISMFSHHTLKISGQGR